MNIYTQTRLFPKVPSQWLNPSSRHHSALWALYGLWVILFFRLASGLCHKLISVYILTYAWLILQGSSTQPSLSRDGETAVSASVVARQRRTFVHLCFCALSQIYTKKVCLTLRRCCYFHHMLLHASFMKKIPPSLTLRLCVSLLISFSPLLFFVFGQSIPV